MMKSYFYSNHDNVGTYHPHNRVKVSALSKPPSPDVIDKGLAINTVSDIQGNEFNLFFITDRDLTLADIAQIVADEVPKYEDLFSYITADVVMQADWIDEVTA